MSTTHTDDAPREILFVLGAPRSGTTFLVRLLFEFFDYGLGPEGHWIAPMSRRAAAIGDLSEPANLERLVEEILATEMFEIVREQYSDRYGRTIDVSKEGVLERVREPAYPSVAYAALECLAHQLGRSRVASKDPGFYRELDTLNELFPTEAKYLCVVRDGR
ncbi:MAG: sulfotransferase, partial [Gemmatimonadetes bacterium]|nr:sulfotransferase [Gemmatimonadota bacterium]